MRVSRAAGNLILVCWLNNNNGVFLSASTILLSHLTSGVHHFLKSNLSAVTEETPPVCALLTVLNNSA